MSRPGVVVRRGGVEDAASLARLRLRWRARDVEPFGAPGFEGALAAWMLAHRASHVPFLASLGADDVAMAWLAVVDRVPDPERVSRRSGYVQSAFVTPEHRGAGIGTELLATLIAHAAALELDYLAVHPSARSVSLYRRLGFEGTDRVLELRPVEAPRRT